MFKSQKYFAQIFLIFYSNLFAILLKSHSEFTQICSRFYSKVSMGQSSFALIFIIFHGNMEAMDQTPPNNRASAVIAAGLLRLSQLGFCGYRSRSPRTVAGPSPYGKIIRIFSGIIRTPNSSPDSRHESRHADKLLERLSVQPASCSPT